MSEKRKPDTVLLLRYDGKKKSNKIEFFKAEQWGWVNTTFTGTGQMYRVRVNGKWFKGKDGKKYFWKSQLRDVVWRSMKL